MIKLCLGDFRGLYGYYIYAFDKYVAVCKYKLEIPSNFNDTEYNQYFFHQLHNAFVSKTNSEALSIQ